MAKVYASPIPAPDYDYSQGLEHWQRAEALYVTALRTWLIKHCGSKQHKLMGKIIRLPWADGCAQYMILNGTTLIHMPLGDAWNVPEYTTRGLRADDLARMASDD